MGPIFVEKSFVLSELWERFFAQIVGRNCSSVANFDYDRPRSPIGTDHVTSEAGSGIRYVKVPNEEMMISVFRTCLFPGRISRTFVVSWARKTRKPVTGSGH